MQIALEHLDLGKLTFASEGEPPAHRVAVRSAGALRGQLSQAEGRLELRELAAAQLVLDALRLVFGSVVIQAEREAVIAQLQGSMLRSAARLELALTATGLEALALGVEVAATKLGGETRMRGVALDVSSDGGRLVADRLEVDAFRADNAQLGCGATRLLADQLSLGWGRELRISASRVELPVLTVSRADGTRLELSGVTLTQLELRGSRISLGGLQVSQGRLALPLGGSAEGSPQSGRTASVARAAAARPEPQPQAFDLRLLDGLSGHLQVDALVDMTIPIFGSRRATHPLRLTVEDGTVDYRELEEDLAPLESSLLDFSVRENELVLERGIPLLPTRGFGKPIIRWELSAEDRLLADQRRVRLSLLPHFKPPEGNKAPGDEETPSKVALRKLGLTNIDLRLSLRSTTSPHSAVRRLSIQELIARGNVRHHVSEEDPDGAIEGSLAELALTIEGLRLGSHTVAIGELRIARVPRCLLRFSGLKPNAVELTLEGLALRDLAIQPLDDFS